MDETGSLFRRVAISNIRQETDGVKTFILSADFIYKAGQFITILSPDGRNRRSYSFSSSPDTDNYAAITVKRVPNGLMSRHLIDTIRPGDELNISGPYGFFTLPASFQQYRQVVFLAAGIGITPVFSLIKSLLKTGPEIPVTLIYSNTSVTTTIFYLELQALAEQYAGRFRVEFLFSTASDLSRARLNKALLPQLLGEYLQADKQQALFYTCGPFSYMRMVLLALKEEHIPHENIRKEHFNTQVITSKLAPPDTGAHQVILHYRGQQAAFETQYPDTILSSARKNGITLPYSCDNGICGTCVARCIKGKAWHRNNEVLTEKDLKNGLILTCTAYPLYGDIELEIK